VRRNELLVMQRKFIIIVVTGLFALATIVGAAFQLRTPILRFWNLRKLRLGNQEEKEAAVAYLLRVRCREALPVLEDIVKHSYEMNLGITKSLEQLGWALLPLIRMGTSDKLRDLLSDKEDSFRLWFLCLLADFGRTEPEVEPVIIASLSDPYWRVRQQAVTTLALQVPPKEATFRALLSVMNGDPDSNVRWQVAKDLGDSGFPSTLLVPVFLEILRSEEVEWRWLGVRNLRGLADDATLTPVDGTRIVEQLTALLSEEDREIRKSAIRALASYGAKSAISQLTKLSKDPDSEIREAAVEALEVLSSPGGEESRSGLTP